MLGDEFVWKAVEKSGALGQHEGITSNHTLQWVDLSLVKLFGTDHIPPMARNQREFTLAHAKKKSKFQESVQEQHDLHRLDHRIQALAEDFTRVGPMDEDGLKFRTLTERYNNIDELVKSTLRHAATSVGRKKHGISAVTGTHPLHKKDPPLESSTSLCETKKAIHPESAAAIP